MSGPFGSSQWMYSSGGFYPTEIEQSLRFNDDDSAYLDRGITTTGDRQKFTFSCWLKRGNISTAQALISAGQTEASTLHDRIEFDSSTNKLELNIADGTYVAATEAVLRDTSAWYHIIVSVDYTQVSSTDRVKMYVNGVDQSWTGSAPPQNYANGAFNWSGTEVTAIGTRYRQGSYAGYYFDGYLAEVNFIDGQALDPTDFGEFKSGVWVAKEYEGSYGTNGFYLNFSDSSAIGDDLSGNANDWTANNLVATDVVLDSPTNNFCTFNPLTIQANVTLSEGNLQSASTGTSSDLSNTTISPKGKWYAEFVFTSGSDGSNDSRLGNNARVSRDGTTTGLTGSAFAGFSNGDVIQLAVDIDNQTLEAGVNNSYTSYTFTDAFIDNVGVFRAGDNVGTVIANFGQDSSFAGNKTAQGNTDDNGVGDFYYAPPSGYLALCTANLPDPVIDPAKDDVPSDYFNTVLYTGNGSTQSITGVGFQPDWVWTKMRSATASHALVDAVRGSTKAVFSNGTFAEETHTTGITSFDTDGYSLGASPYYNTSSETFVAWNWLAGNGTSSNTSGSITSTVSVNQKAGFSVVSYTGTGAAATVGHGLGVAPDMIIAKSRTNSTQWRVWHKDFPSGYQAQLNLTDAPFSDVNVFTTTVPTSSVFSIGTSSQINVNTYNYIAYCFAEVEGYSKFGSYTGNGSTDGPMIWTGHAPAFLIIKRTDSADDWSVYDNTRSPYNQRDELIYANSSNAETANDTGHAVDFLSNGFKCRGTSAQENANGGSYIYMSFSSNPFKYSNAL